VNTSRSHRRADKLLLSTSILLALAGALAMAQMPKQEDPRVAPRWGLLLTPYPGAAAEEVERLVVEPIEEALVEVEEISLIETTARFGVAVTQIELVGDVADTDRAWTAVRRALDDARDELPEGAGRYVLQDDLVSPEAIVLGVTGRMDRRELARIAREMERELLGLPAVRSTRIVGDPESQLSVEADDARLRPAGIHHRDLAEQIRTNHALHAVGSILAGDRRVQIQLDGELDSPERLGALPILLPDGSQVPLASLASVKREARLPEAPLLRIDGEPAVGIAIVPRSGIDAIRFGHKVRDSARTFVAGHPEITLHEIAFQPDHVRARILELGGSLVLGIAVVAVTLFLTMGVRTGAIVSTMIPVVALAAVGIYAAGGGTLHQLSIAALVMALGLIVDNAIVVTEGALQRVESGTPPGEASWGTARELALPLGISTATTISAFLPMILAVGKTADFVRAIPIVLTSSLLLGLLFSLLVTPVLAGVWLAPRAVQRSAWSVRLGTTLGRFVLAHPRFMVLAGLTVLAACALGSLRVEQRFFPDSNRRELITTVELPEGSDLSATDRAARQLEQALLGRDDVDVVTAFVGESAPLFYYNLSRYPSSPHLAQVVVTVRDRAGIRDVMDFCRDFAWREMPEALVSVRRLQQGPPVDAPIEVRLYGEGEHRVRAADEVLRALRSIPGAIDVRHDQSAGVPLLRVEMNHAAASRFGIVPGDVALALLRQSSGFEVGRFREDDETTPIRLRGTEARSFTLDGISTLDVAAAEGEPIPLSRIATWELDWQAGAIHRRNRRHVATVSANLADGVPAVRVVRQLERAIENAPLPEGVRMEIGGEIEGSSESTRALARKLPFGLLALLFFLLVEFGSFRRVGLILLSIPLASAGIVPGLLLSGQPFGFMATLGVLALAGVVVNNAIVLLDVVERRRRQGSSVDEALLRAIEQRLRPILLTTVTTIAGMLPLALSGTELWPPMAWTMISGLTASTGLTLLLIPALYKLVIR
jgi:multidrug efflux pump subunit AcrB